MAKKVFVLLPDGVGIRNFIHTDFPEIAMAMDLQVCLVEHERIAFGRRL